MKVQYTPHQNADIRPIAPQRMPRRPSVKRFLGTAAAGAATSIDAADAAADEEIAWSMRNPISEVPTTGSEKLNADARSEERREGKEGVSTCRPRGAPND